MWMHRRRRCRRRPSAAPGRRRPPAEFYYPALKPWVHYVPSGWNGFDEVDRIVQFLRTHDSLARGIAASGQRFARTHLVEEGRLCYLKARGARARRRCRVGWQG